MSKITQLKIQVTGEEMTRDMKDVHLLVAVTVSLHQLHVGEQRPVNLQASVLRASRKQVCETLVSYIENAEKLLIIR